MSTVIVPFIYGKGEDLEQGLIVRMYLTMIHKVPMRYIKYIGKPTDCSYIREGACLAQYNIIKKGHEKYKSTVSAEWAHPDEVLIERCTRRKPEDRCEHCSLKQLHMKEVV